MSLQPRRDTGPEIALRRELHRAGLRYFIHRRPIASSRREADIVSPRAKVAVFVDGCYWHHCPDHGAKPKVNENYWASKLERTVERDRETDGLLKRAGWIVVRVWEHERPELASSRITCLVKARALASS